MSTTDSNAAFEAYMREQGHTDDDLKRPYGNYFWKGVSERWEGWQAALEWQAATEAAKATGTAGEMDTDAILSIAKAHGFTTTQIMSRGPELIGGSVELHERFMKFGQACARAAWLAGGQHQHEVEKAARQPAPVALSDDQINDLWNALPGIEIHNKAYAQGMATDYALRIAFAKAIIAATNRSQP